MNVNSNSLILFDELVIDTIIKKNYKNLVVYCWLKLLYPEGNPKIKEIDFAEICNKTGFSDERSIKTAINSLIESGWLKHHRKIERLYILNQERICKIKKWKGKVVIVAKHENLTKNSIYSFCGAVLYTRLFRSFCVKFKKDNKKVKAINGIDYHTYFKGMYTQPRPISIVGASKIFNIPITTADRLKNAAKKAKLIKVKKNYSNYMEGKHFLSIRANHPEWFKFSKKNGKTVYREIDLIIPNIQFKCKRRGP